MTKLVDRISLVLGCYTVNSKLAGADHLVSLIFYESRKQRHHRWPLVRSFPIQLVTKKLSKKDIRQGKIR